MFSGAKSSPADLADPRVSSELGRRRGRVSQQTSWQRQNCTRPPSLLFSWWPLLHAEMRACTHAALRCRYYYLAFLHTLTCPSPRLGLLPLRPWNLAKMAPKIAHSPPHEDVKAPNPERWVFPNTLLALLCEGWNECLRNLPAPGSSIAHHFLQQPSFVEVTQIGSSGTGLATGLRLEDDGAHAHFRFLW